VYTGVTGCQRRRRPYKLVIRYHGRKGYEYPFVRIKWKSVDNGNPTYHRLNIPVHKLAWLWKQFHAGTTATECDEILAQAIQLDHIDDDRHNWHPDNIQVLTVTDNQAKRFGRELTQEEYDKEWEGF